MARFEIETIDDPDTGHVLVEVRHGDAVVAKSGPVYGSHQEAQDRVLDAVSKAWPDQPTDPVYPANGS